MAGGLGTLARAALGLALPARCPGCGSVTGSDGLFCAGCFARLKLLGPPWCARCGDSFETAAPPGTRCRRCEETPPPYDGARAPLAYEDPARAMVLRLKHGDALHLAGAMAGPMARVGGEWLETATLVPVPLHPRRLWKRGYNQAALIAQALRRRTGARLAVDALRRHRATLPSGELSREERFANVRGAFRVARPQAVQGADIVLVDDVMTSGATAAACAETLREGGARSVRVLAFARVVRGAGPAHLTGLD